MPKQFPVFTLTVTLIILGIVPLYASNPGARSVCSTNLKNLATACDLYGSKNGGMYPDSLDKTVPEYFEQVPKCLITDWDYAYEVSHNPERFTITCRGWAHRDFIGDKNNCYTSETGLVELREPVPTEEEDSIVRKKIREYKRQMKVYDVTRFLKTYRIPYIILGILLILTPLLLKRRRDKSASEK